MFILDEPYVSSLLLETVLKNGYEILENDFMKAEAATYNCNGFCGKFNFVSKKEALDVIENGKVYTNSENFINFIMEIVRIQILLKLFPSAKINFNSERR